MQSCGAASCQIVRSFGIFAPMKSAAKTMLMRKPGSAFQLACHSGGASFPSVLIQSSPISPPITDAGR